MTGSVGCFRGRGNQADAIGPSTHGPGDPHDILSVLGEKALHAYLVNEIQEISWLQGVTINDGRGPGEDAASALGAVWAAMLQASHRLPAGFSTIGTTRVTQESRS